MEKKEYYGDVFQEKSKNVRAEGNQSVSERSEPNTYKTYQNTISVISLPEPEFLPELTFWDVIKNRHTTRAFSNKSISFMELSLMLYGISGITRKFPGFTFRTVPSAGAFYPIETYLVVNRVDHLEQGLYHYEIENHKLEYLKEGDFGKSLSEACYGVRMVAKSAITFIWTAIIERSRKSYGERAYRFIYLDCGHIGQNFYLVAKALGLSACVIGAYFDDEVNDFLGLNEKEEFTVYMGVLGRGRR